MDMRIDKLLSTLQYGSRKEIKEAAKDGRIQVNGKIVKDSSVIVNENLDIIQIDDETVFYKPSLTLMMNKPEGYVSANQDNIHQTVMDLLPDKYVRLNLSVAGRLDLDTTGLLLLTNDGALLHEIISPKSETWKTYRATLHYPLEHLDKLEKGVTILDGNDQSFLTRPAKIHVLSDKEVAISIHEGKFHQVKRMFEVIGNEVASLCRVSIGELSLPKDLYQGEVRELTLVELEKLFTGKIAHL